MAFKEAPIIIIYNTSEDELEDTACSYFKEYIETDLIDSQILKKRKRMDTPAKRTFHPHEFNVKKAECSSNEKDIIGKRLDGSHESEADDDIQSSDDDQSMSPVPKRRKRLTAPAYFAILTRKKKRPVNKISCDEYVEEKSGQSSVGSFIPEISEMNESEDSNSYKINKKRLTAAAYGKFLIKCNMRIFAREVSRIENLILRPDI